MTRRQILIVGIVIIVGVVGVLLVRMGLKVTSVQTPETPQAALLANIEALSRQDGDLTNIRQTAEELHSQMLNNFPNTPEANQANEVMEDFNVRVLFSSTASPDSINYEVVPGDTLSSIARRHNTTVELIMRANGLTSDRIRSGQVLKLTKTNFAIRVDKSENRLWLSQGERVIKGYTVSTGENGITPVGDFQAVDFERSANLSRLSKLPCDAPEHLGRNRGDLLHPLGRILGSSGLEQPSGPPGRAWLDGSPGRGG